ncbi:MAG: hypothetical protein IJA10_05395 [Lachnospiraceae bacterium]|nr:hypothetical protein [Lachnospiraceae bacterium]
MNNRNEFYDLSDSPIIISDTNVKKPKKSGGVNVNFKSFFKIIFIIAIIAVVYHFGKKWIDEYKRPVIEIENTYLKSTDILEQTFDSDFIENSAMMNEFYMNGIGYRVYGTKNVYVLDSPAKERFGVLVTGDDKKNKLFGVAIGDAFSEIEIDFTFDMDISTDYELSGGKSARLYESLDGKECVIIVSDDKSGKVTSMIYINNYVAYKSITTLK